jgi:hypothetical protein
MKIKMSRFASEKVSEGRKVKGYYISIRKEWVLITFV